MKINFNKRTIFAIGFMSLIISFLFNTIIFDNKTFGSPDSLSPKAIGIGLNKEFKDTNEFPQWQPWVFSGMPSAEAFTNISNLYFPEYFFKIFFLSGILIQLLHLLFAGIGCFFLLKYFKCSDWASFLGATGFMVTPYMVTMVVFGHGSQMMTAAYIPWVLWLTVQLWEKPNLFKCGWLGILLGFQLQRAHVQIAYYTWLMIGAYVLLMIIAEIKRNEDQFKIIKKFGIFSLACVLGIGLSMLIYLPAIDYSEYSIRGGSTSGGADYDYATGWSFHPKEILTFFIPSAFGFGGQPYWGFMPFTDYPNYMGIIILMLAFIGLLGKKELIHWFFLITSLLALFISFGKHFSPIYNLFYNFFPYFNKFRVPHMILILLQFNIAILAAFGLDKLIKIRKENIPQWFWIFCGFAGLILIVLSIGGPFIESFVRESFPLPRTSDAFAAQKLNNLRWDLWINDSWLMLIFFASFLVLIWLRINKTISKQLFFGLIIFSGVIDIAMVNYKIIDPSRKSGRSSQLISNRAVNNFFSTDEIVTFLKSDQNNFRIYPIGPLFGESRFAAFGLESIGGYHPAKLKIYNDFLQKTRNAASIPVLRMMNAKYLISPQKIENPYLSLVKQDMLKSAQGNIPVEVYKLSNFMPRAWFVKNIQVIDDNDVYQKIIEPNFDPQALAFVNKMVDSPSKEKAEIVDFEKHSNKITISTKSLGNQFLVLSEVYYPLRWKAYIDGDKAEILKVNGIIRGLSLSSGDHKIEFIYDKSSFSSGRIISFISFSLLLCMLMVGVYFKRK